MALGVLVRLLFAWTQRTSELAGDEGIYLHLALSWKHFGFYSDSYRYLWPPGYPWILRQALDLFGAGAVTAVLCLQALASAATGAAVMAIARGIFGGKAALASGLVWSCYLPLIQFSGSLWTESLFLALFTPAMALVLAHRQGRAGRSALVGAALGTAGALYLKEAALYFVPLAAWLATRVDSGLRRRLSDASLYLLLVAACLAPWQRHVRHVYGGFVPLGATLGENSFLGLNASYQNIDFTPLMVVRKANDLPSLRGLSRGGTERLRDEPDPEWSRAEEEAHLLGRQSENLARGLELARSYPEWFLLSRLRKLADFVTPLSFWVRDQAIAYPAPRSLSQRLSVLVAAVSPALLMLAAWTGLLAGTTSWRERRYLLLWLAYFSATALLVSMSRFRAPILPVLFVGVGGLFHAPRWNAGRALLWLTGVSLLLAAWWWTWPEAWTVIRMAWGQG